LCWAFTRKSQMKTTLDIVPGTTIISQAWVEVVVAVKRYDTVVKCTWLSLSIKAGILSLKTHSYRPELFWSKGPGIRYLEPGIRYLEPAQRV
jgi:hypothetical protein